MWLKRSIISTAATKKTPVIVDANVLLYAVKQDSQHHIAALTWLRDALHHGPRIGLPAQTISAFLRIATNRKITPEPLTSAEAWATAANWLDHPNVWVPPMGERTLRILGELIVKHQIAANLVMDAQLAALAMEHGVAVASFDSDFLLFDLPVVNPLRP